MVLIGLLKRAIAAFILALYATMALSVGVALADDGSSTGHGSGHADTPATSQRDTVTEDTAEDVTEDTEDPAEDTAEDVTDNVTEDTAADPVEDVTEDTAEDVGAPAEPAGAADRRRAERALEAAAVTDVPAGADRSVTDSPADPGPASRRELAEVDEATASTDEASPAALLRDARADDERATVAPDVAPGPRPYIAPRLDRQLAGGFSDVGTILASVVYATATAVAHAFGPDSFFGVPHLLATFVANTAAAVGRTLVGGFADAVTGPLPVTYGLLDGMALFRPTKSPAGANDPSVGVTPEKPLPIILLNSTVITQGMNWSVGAPVLANAGYKVYTFNYGNVTTNPNALIQSIGDIRNSGLELAAEIDRVLAETGAPQVILIGHSQGGGALPSYYINNLGGADKVSQLIGIGPGHHGTTFMGLVSLVLQLPVLRQLYIGISERFAPAFYQQSYGSPFVDEVYGNGDTRPGVRYTTISTAYDEVATPYTLQALDGPNVTNIVLQHRYPGLLLGHLNMVTSPYTWSVVLEELAANPAANPAQTVRAEAA
ncbi:lipase [Mycobacterium sp. ITM-2016-00317]|uniref:esterase/lipase family protein n=1 Tax=Mycobacterium sp. ITM-2016-00317 TaxID=2099694 RepID=UPI00287F653A|nr:alpha/beta fold hydrolase [Mycobacterium sp. ITM-2016-00317]WNG89900.1 lipase [Mycobacterium sp. ITM-2016-00317]